MEERPSSDREPELQSATPEETQQIENELTTESGRVRGMIRAFYILDFMI